MIAAVNPGKVVGKSKLQLGSKNQCSYGRNLTLSYDENIIVCEARVRLSVSGNKQKSKPMKTDRALRRFPHRMDCLIMRCFENSTFAFLSIPSESLLTGAVERSLGICTCSIVSATVVYISSTFIDV